ncbi:MAG: Rieske (2Fe-2S) protein [Vicinamibacterales bacterium]
MVNRRSFLGTIVHAIFGTISAVVGVVLGGAVLKPARAGSTESWQDAGVVAALVEGEPKEVALRIERNDGYYTTTERRILYLVRANGQVRAFSSTCTHLGCRVAWHADGKAFKCPCHGGQYAIDGSVVAGPPPRGLDEVALKVDSDRVMVQLG